MMYVNLWLLITLCNMPRSLVTKLQGKQLHILLLYEPLIGQCQYIATQGFLLVSVFWQLKGLVSVFWNPKSSHQRCSVKEGVLKSFTNLAAKHLCWSLFLIKLQAFRPLTSLKETPTQMLSCEFAKKIKTPILKNIWKRLLLEFQF